MKIVYLSPSGQLGGAERNLLDLLAGLREARPSWRTEVIVSADGPLAARARELGAAVTMLRMPAAASRMGDSGRGALGESVARRLVAAGRLVRGGAAAAAYGVKLRRAIRAAAPDIVHSNAFKMHFLGACLRPPRAAMVWHIHDYISPRPIMRRLMPLCAPRCRVAIANSDDVAADVNRQCGSALPVVRVYNGVDFAEFSPEGPRLDLDSLAGLTPAPKHTVRVGLVGTMARWKGHRVFLRALAQIPGTIPIRGYVIGGQIYHTDGSEETLDALREFATELGLGERVGFTGFVEEPARAMRALDIIVHASTSPEPFGRVIAEAMASQRAVVVSRAGGAAELIKDEETALAFTPGDHVALARQLERLAAEPEMRARLARNGRLSALERFDRRRAVAEIIQVYQKLGRPIRKFL